MGIQWRGRSVALLGIVIAAGCSSGPLPPTQAPTATVAPTVVATPVWESVLMLGPVTDVVVTGGAFESPGSYRLVASCMAPGRLLIETDDGPLTFVCTSDGSARTQVVATGRRGRTLIDVDSGLVSVWSVDVQVPVE